MIQQIHDQTGTPLAPMLRLDGAQGIVVSAQRAQLRGQLPRSIPREPQRQEECRLGSAFWVIRGQEVIATFRGSTWS